MINVGNIGQLPALALAGMVMASAASAAPIMFTYSGTLEGYNNYYSASTGTDFDGATFSIEMVVDSEAEADDIYVYDQDSIYDYSYTRFDVQAQATVANLANGADDFEINNLVASFYFYNYEDPSQNDAFGFNAYRVGSAGYFGAYGYTTSVGNVFAQTGGITSLESIFDGTIDLSNVLDGYVYSGFFDYYRVTNTSITLAEIPPAVPLPAGLGLSLTALGFLGVAASRRRTKVPQK